MKRIKAIMLLIFCTLTCCLFVAGCQSGASYIKDSFKAYSGYSSNSTSEIRFLINVEKAGKYEISYVLYADGVTGVAPYEGKETIEIKDSDLGVYSFKDSVWLYCAASQVKIRNVKIKYLEGGDVYKIIPIIMGSVAGTALIFLTVAFIADKAKNK